MRFKKIMLAGIILLAIMAIGAVGAADAEIGIFLLQLLQGMFCLACLNLLDVGHDRFHSLLVAPDGVHGELVHVTEFLLHRTYGIVVFQQLVEDAVDALVVVLLQTVETAEARVGGW